MAWNWKHGTKRIRIVKMNAEHEGNKQVFFLQIGSGKLLSGETTYSFVWRSKDEVDNVKKIVGSNRWQDAETLKELDEKVRAAFRQYIEFDAWVKNMKQEPKKVHEKGRQIGEIARFT